MLNAEYGAILRDASYLVVSAGVPLGAGWAAERLVDTGLRIRGVVLLCGLGGAWIGSWAWASAGWEPGPRLLDQAVLPAFAGAVAVCGLLKMIALGTAGSQR